MRKYVLYSFSAMSRERVAVCCLNKAAKRNYLLLC